VSKNTYRCFVCGASGGTIDLVMRHLHVDFREACRWLADEHNIIIDEWKPQTSDISHQTSFDASRYERFFEHPWLNEEARRFLFDERRLDPRVVGWCRLTSWKDKQGVAWLQIPYYNKEGQLVGIQNRNLVRGALPRFRFPQGSRCSIYNLPVLMLSAGHKAIAIPSATLLSRKDKEQLSIINYQFSIKFEMFPDNDTPGERLFLQLREVLPSLVRHQLPPGCKDFSDYYLSECNRGTVLL